jgi:hypothetical protein
MVVVVLHLRPQTGLLETDEEHCNPSTSWVQFPQTEMNRESNDVNIFILLRDKKREKKYFCHSCTLSSKIYRGSSSC